MTDLAKWIWNKNMRCKKKPEHFFPIDECYIWPLIIILRTIKPLFNWMVHFTEPQSMDCHVWAAEVDCLNGRLDGLPKWTALNCLPWKGKDIQSSVVLIDDSKLSINDGFTSGSSQKLTRQTKMQTIIHIQLFTSLLLLRTVKDGAYYCYCAYVLRISR